MAFKDKIRDFGYVTHHMPNMQNDEAETYYSDIYGLDDESLNDRWISVIGLSPSSLLDDII